MGEKERGYRAPNPKIRKIFRVKSNCETFSTDEKKIILYKAQEFNLNKLIQTGCYIAQPSAFFKNNILNKVGLLNLDLHYAMDYDLWIRIGKKGKALYIPQVLSNFRISDYSKSGSQEEQFWPETRKVSLKYGGL